MCSSSWSRLDFTESVTVVAGGKIGQKKRFTVYKYIITAHPEFFRAACNGGFEEAKDKIVRLPEVEPETFGCLLHWIYTGHIVVMNEEDIDATERQAPSLRYVALVELYALADKYGEPRLRNATIDQIIELADTTEIFPGTGVVDIACNKTSRRSNLRKVLADYYNACAELEWLLDHQDELAAEFYFEMAMRMKEGINDSPNVNNKCRYHEHNDDVPKCS
ncbi:BTB/POZ fold [Teratosphaeria destructans]|uniref:BTB/POZ fold n=1 Tax=Teratosphaeria destructans TaxID=418781 RepID=A0A9W7VXW6_9PEZI|nr:BTB/POZ fold [Teratosphaeria destructans]